MQSVHLQGFSYDERNIVLHAIKRALESCGCWLLEQSAIQSEQIDLQFEAQLRDVYELYSELIAAGVEMTKENHARMTGLCTLRNHNPRNAIRRRIVTIRLEVSFLDAYASDMGLHGIGLA